MDFLKNLKIVVTPRKLALIGLSLLLGTATMASTHRGLLGELRDLKHQEAKHFFRLQKQLASVSSSDISEIKKLYQEHRKRAEMLDQLIFYTDTHFKNQDDKQFLSGACLELAKREIQDPNHSGDGHWQFFRNFSQVLHETQDSDLSAASLLRSYMTYSSVMSPKDPKSFLGPRNYTNGDTFSSAPGVTRTEVGELVSINETPITATGQTFASDATSHNSPEASLQRPSTPVLKPALVIQNPN